MKQGETKQLNNSSEAGLAKKNLRRQAVVAGASLVLVVALILGGTVAWYTRLVNVTGMTFEVASFEINASYVEESFLINPYDYSEIEDGKAAPGAMGYIPVEITSTVNNEVAVEYRLNVDDTAMAPEFAERIRFYYYTYDEDSGYVEHELGFGEDDIQGSIPADQDGVTEYIYWEWEYTADLSPILDEAGVTSLSQISNADLYTTWNKMSGNWTDSTSKTVIAQLYSGSETTATTTISTGIKDEDGVVGSEVVTTTYPAVDSSVADYAKKRGANMRDYIEYHYMYAWDYVDTQVAMGNWDDAFTSSNEMDYEKTTIEVVTDDGGTEFKTYTAYQVAMQVTLSIIGAQAEPLENDEVSAISGTGTVKYDST